MKNKPWTVSTFKERLAFYKKMLAKNTDPEKQERLQTIIKSYEEFIKEFTTSYKRPSYPTICKLDQEKRKTINEILPIILKANDILLANNTAYQKELFSINTSKDTILKTTRDFYTMIGGIYKEKYDEYYDTNGIYINFNDRFDNSVCGNIKRPRGIAECFINISLFNNPYDIATSIHEHSHAVAASIYEDHMNHPFFNEVESILFELLFVDMLDKDQYTMDQIRNVKRVTIGMYSRIINSIEAKAITSLKGIKDPNIARKIIEEKYNMDNDEINDIINSPLSNYLNYGLSYLIAIELYYIYKRCDYKALDILEEIIRIDSEEEDIILKYLQDLSITPGNNFQRFNKEHTLK